MTTNITPAAMLTQQDIEDIVRLDDQIADGDGYSMPRDRMRRLAELGLVRHHSAGRYSITAFGRWAAGVWTELPLLSDEERSATRYTSNPMQTGVGAWCAPGPAAEQQRLFVLRFEDRDRGECHYTDEQEARVAFASAEARGWNCHLLAHVARRPTNPIPGQGGSA